MDGFSEAILASIIGGIVASGIFYLFAGRDLRREAGKLRSLNELLIRGLHNEELVEFSFDEMGKPKGLIIRVDIKDKLTLSGTAEVEAIGTVKNNEEN